MVHDEVLARLLALNAERAAEERTAGKAQWQWPATGMGRHNPFTRRNGEAYGMVHDYFAEISFDGEAGVWYVSDTNFPGLVAEAPSERDLLARIRALVPELYELNRNLFDEPVLEAIPLRMTSNRLETIRLAG